MSTTAIETLNAWGLAWADAMRRSLIEATILLAIVGLARLLLRRWMSSALAHGSSFWCWSRLPYRSSCHPRRPWWSPCRK